VWQSHDQHEWSRAVSSTSLEGSTIQQHVPHFLCLIARCTTRSHLQDHMAHADVSPTAALNPQEWRSVTLLKKDQVNHNTISLRFGFNKPDQVAGLPVASCIIVRAPIGKPQDDGSRGYVIRPYTPVSHPDQKCEPALMKSTLLRLRFLRQVLGASSENLVLHWVGQVWCSVHAQAQPRAHVTPQVVNPTL
jgi:hypothetical protein